MFFAKPEVIDTINSYFVPISVDDAILPGEHGPLYGRIRSVFLARYPFAHGPSAWIILPDTTPYECLNVQLLQHQPDEALKVIRKIIADMDLKPGPPVLKFVPEEFKRMKPDDTPLHVTARFLLDRELNSLDPRVSTALSLGEIPANPAPVIDLQELINIRLVSPIDEWCMLPREDRQAFLPPAEVPVGGQYRIPPRSAAVLYRHLCPPTFNAHLLGKVLEADLVGTVVRRGEETAVRLDGRFASQHQIWGSADDNVAEGTAVGYLVFQTATGEFTRFGMITDPGIYGNRSTFRVPFVTTVELQKGGYQPPKPLPGQKT